MGLDGSPLLLVRSLDSKTSYAVSKRAPDFHPNWQTNCKRLKRKLPGTFCPTKHVIKQLNSSSKRHVVEAARKWFWPGYTTGEEVLLPKEQAAIISAATKEKLGEEIPTVA
jgi:hypothetical protein